MIKMRTIPVLPVFDVEDLKKLLPNLSSEELNVIIHLCEVEIRERSYELDKHEKRH